jgi:hypothetical protein
MRSDAVFESAGRALRLERIFPGHVVNLVPAVKVPQHFERADLAALSGRV